VRIKHTLILCHSRCNFIEQFDHRLAPVG
jgi:hypothetical protein